MVYETMASKLKLSPRELEHESLTLFLKHRLRLVESQRLSLFQKYGVQTVKDLDALVQSGRIHEEEAFEDYFEFDHLESEREMLLESLKDLD